MGNTVFHQNLDVALLKIDKKKVSDRKLIYGSISCRARHCLNTVITTYPLYRGRRRDIFTIQPE
jgi:hypothetical protein